MRRLWSKSRFSKASLIIFGTTFAIIGGYAIWQSFASSNIQTGRTGRTWHFFVAPMTLSDDRKSIRTDAIAMLNNDSQWSYLNQDGDVFQNYHIFWDLADNATRAAQVAMVQRTGLKTSFEVAGLNPGFGCQSGNGVRVAQQSVIPLIQSYASYGGTVDYLMIDSPAYLMMPSLVSGGCAYTSGTVAAELAGYVATVHAAYPNIVFGWNEPVPYYSVGSYPSQFSSALADLPSLIQLVNTQLQIRGVKIDIFRADSPYEYSENSTTQGWNKLAALETAVRQQGMRFAMIFNSEGGGNTSDQLFYQNTLAGWSKFVAAAGVPDEIFIQSWYHYPSVALPETTAYTFTYTAKALLQAALSINSAPIGAIDLVDSSGNILGWTCDADDYSSALAVHFYIDGPAGTLGLTPFFGIADKPREVAVGQNCGGNVNHGFKVAIPSQYRDGKTHVLYAYTINTPSGSNPLLINSQTLKSTTTFTLSAPTPGDLNGDGAVGIYDLSILLSYYGTSNAAADIDRNGIVNVSDLSILLSNYGH